MNLDLVFAVLFYGLVVLFYYKTRDRWEIHGKILALYKTKLGLSLMNKIAKSAPRFIKYLAYSGVFFGFVGMLVIVYILIKSTLILIFVKGAPPQVAPLLPGINFPGLGAISFWHWVIVIIVVATVHEFSHGILARVYNLKVKSSGFGFLGPIMLAFVEPDEKQVGKSSKRAQLSMFAAGPYSNLILGFIFLLIFFFIVAPIGNNLYVVDKLNVNSFTPGLPAESSGLEVPFEIFSINNNKIGGLSSEELGNLFFGIRPDDIVTLTTDQGDFKIKTVADENDASRGLIGIQTEVVRKTKEGVNTFYGSVYDWFRLLFMWLALVSIFVGLFNLLPLGPVDGGRMFYALLLAITKNEEKSKKIWGALGYFFLMLIIINFLPWIGKLFSFLISFFV